MQTFESIIKVTENDLDELNHVNNVRYVQWVQNVAKQHWTQHAPPSILENYFWVMTKHCIEYKNPAYLNDKIKLTTYIKNYKGAISTRIVEITNYENNMLIAKSETKWCLINTKSKRPARITADITEVF